MQENNLNPLESFIHGRKVSTDATHFLDFSWHRRAQDCIAHGALTNSKRPECLGMGVYPTHADQGLGAEISVDKSLYTDFICGLGTNLFGYGNSIIAKAAYEALMTGALFSIGSKLEVTAAEKAKEVWPCIEKLRFLKTGTEACMAAIKIARAYSNKNLVLSEGYHGWSDEFVSLTPPALGVPDYHTGIKPFSWELLPHAAAVIIEPVQTIWNQERREFLFKLRDECEKHNVVLIFDEIVTGMRFKGLSVSNHIGLKPDLICLGKAIAGGMPLSIVGGRADIMECGEYFVSSTFAGDRASLNCFLSAVKLIHGGYDIDHLWNVGTKFINAFNALYPEKIRIQGYPTRGIFIGEENFKWAFFEHCARAGILFGPSWFFAFPHIDLMDQVILACRGILSRIRSGELTRSIPLPHKPFATKVRENGFKEKT